MNNIKGRSAFTFMELIVVTIILAILWAIWFSSFVWNLSYSRDSQRKSNMSEIFASMKLYKKNKWSYPIPAEFFSITNGWSGTSKIVAWQWKLSSNVWLSTLDKIPLDPELEIPYLYSITKNKQEFQIAWTLENDRNPYAITIGSYKSVAKTVLPTILIALESTWSVEIQDWIWTWNNKWEDNRKKFIFNWGKHNLPYNFDWNNLPVSDWTDFDTILLEAESMKTFSQNSSFETCADVQSAWKYIWDWNYELRSATDWSLSTLSCP